MKKYNNLVSDVFGLRLVAGEIGLEVEVEGDNLHHGDIGNHWNHHIDRSLRGPDSAEYVLTQPISREILPKALSELFTSFKTMGCNIRQNSPNTSVHVHLNVQSWTVKEVYNLVCLWYVLEHILVDWCGKERTGNLFCLRGSDAEFALQRLASAIRYGRYNEIIDQDGLRYLALNYTSIGKFGSLEFRPLAGVYNQDIIQTWVEMLLSLKDFAKTFDSPPDILVEYSKSGPDEFIKKALRGNLWKLVTTNPDWRQKLHFGMRLIQNVAYCVNWEKADSKQKEAPEKKKDPFDVEFNDAYEELMRRLDERFRYVEFRPIELIAPLDINGLDENDALEEDAIL